MVWRAHLILIAFFCTFCMGAGCDAELQLIEICQIDVVPKLCHCALAGEEYDKPITYCDKYVAMSESNVRRVGNRLAECRKIEESCEQEKLVK